MIHEIKIYKENLSGLSKGTAFNHYNFSVIKVLRLYIN